MLRTIHLCLILCLVAVATSARSPETESKPVMETLHGIEWVDPYRWLEGSDAPEITEENPVLDARVASWTAKQNAYTRSILDQLPGRQQLKKRLEELLTVGTVRAPMERQGLYFFVERKGDQSQSVLYVRRGLHGEPRVLMDPNQFDPSGLTTLSFFLPSPDGKRVAFGLFQGGDENTTLYLLRSENAEWLADEIPGRVTSVQWEPDGNGFFYRRLADTKNPYSAEIAYHRVGIHHRQDPVLFEQYKEGPLATTFGPYGFTDPQTRWMGLIYYTGTQANDLWVYDLEQWRETGELRRIDLVIGEKAQNVGSIIGDTFFLHTTSGAPNGQLYAIDLRRPERKNWRLLVPERDDAVIRNVSFARDFFAVEYLHKASTQIDLFDHDGVFKRHLELPGIGTANITTHFKSTEAFLSFESYNEPDSIYHIDLSTGKRALWARPDVPVEPERIGVKQVSYPSKDGTEVTMFIVHPKGIDLDGRHPTILNGYGGFNIALTPRFRSTFVPWIEAGGIFAVANLRGGGEYGEDWHRAGMLGNKQNVFDDFIAAAEYLIDNKYTNADQLGILGGSNGGLLTGAALVQRPELFSAVISAVPLLDMLRYQHFLMARFWVPEYGSAEDPEQLDYLLGYSPYQNVKPGTKYPAVLLTAGENDTRVHPLHARKMAARLQAATTNDTEKEPIMLWVEGDVGHGQGKPLAIRLRENADELGFLGWQLGLGWSQPTVSGVGASPTGSR